ncbi:hypothetical protein [Mycolicibacterium sp. SCSIO 43805]|uniref:hypothetical protein n=1 Tax=Mycolicibacterium sp. SCSIO 43805 TaxID=3378074 RepID=UPI003AB61C3E
MVAAAGVAACIGSRLAQSSWGALAGVAILLYPLNIYTATTLYPQAFATLLIMALWLTAIRISDSTQAKPTALYALSGLLAGLLALAVPTLALTGVVIILWVAIQARSDRLRALIIQGLGLAMPIAAWTLRNAAVIGSPVPLSTSGGINLLIGNNATATGSSGVGVAIEQYKSAAAHMNEVDADRYFRKSALEWIQSNPFDSLTLYIAKVANYFSPFNEPVTESQGTALQEIVAIASFTILVALLLLRVLLRRRRPLEPTERLFLGLFAANAFVMAIFFTRTRFRQPLDNILLVEAALACVIIIVHITKQNSRDSAGGEPQ